MNVIFVTLSVRYPRAPGDCPISPLPVRVISMKIAIQMYAVLICIRYWIQIRKRFLQNIYL